MLIFQRLLDRTRRALSGLAILALAGGSAQAQAIGASTAQNLPGGAMDPYWRFIPGTVDYRSPDALTLRGSPAAVTSRNNMGTWTPRSRSPEQNFNNGWIGASDATETAAAMGDNTMRLFLDLSKRKLSQVHLAGTVWGDLCVKHIYVNGKLLNHYIGDGICEQNVIASTVGLAFSVSQADGLVQGVNVLDFVYYKQDSTCDGIRVDFHMIFRETRDRPLTPPASAPAPADSTDTTSSAGPN